MFLASHSNLRAYSNSRACSHVAPWGSRAFFWVQTAVLSLSLTLLSTTAFAAENPSDDGHTNPQNSTTRRERLRIVRQDGTAFGTQIQILATANTDVEARLVSAHLEAAFAELSRVATLLDDKDPDSELGRINSYAGAAPVAVEPEVFSLLLEAERMAKLTGGAFDPTFAALNGVWRFSKKDEAAPLLPQDLAQKDAKLSAVPPSALSDAGIPSSAAKNAQKTLPHVPNEALIAYYRALVSHRDLVLAPAARTAKLKRKGMRLSLGGIGKGYALDLAAQKLQSLGVKNFIVSAGGDLVVRGKKGSQPWKVGIQDPRAQGYFAALSAHEGAVMTTGDYERFFFEKGQRYHHIIDPRTGWPAQGLRSVTVLAQNALVADAFSTAVFVLGAKEGLAMIERMKNIEAILVTEKNDVLFSSGLKNTVDFRPPTDAP